jgi:hypothetical protein
MKVEFDISCRIAEMRERIQLLEKKASDEMEKPIHKRDRTLLKFIHREQSVYRYSLSQLEWVMTE